MFTLRIIKLKKEILCLCANGSIAKADTKLLLRLLTNFTHSKEFKGTYGYWNGLCSDMEEYPGTTLAFVERNRLVILDENLFAEISSQDEYVSVSEYAQMHKKSRPMIKKLCLDGRLQGAMKHSTGWLIPKNAPYPERKPREANKNERIL